MKPLLISSDKVLEYLKGKLSAEESYVFEEMLLKSAKSSELEEKLAEWQESPKKWDVFLQKVDASFEQALGEPFAEEEAGTFKSSVLAPTTFEVEEALLQSGLEETASSNEASVRKLDHVFQTALQEEQTDQQQPKVLPFRWWEKSVWIAAACATFLLIGFFFINRPGSTEYYVLGEETTLSSTHQEVANTRNLFLNKLNRLLRFREAVSSSQRQEFKEEILVLCASEASVFLPNRQTPISIEALLEAPDRWLETNFDIKQIQLTEYGTWGPVSRTHTFLAIEDTLQSLGVHWQWSGVSSDPLVTAVYFE